MEMRQLAMVISMLLIAGLSQAQMSLTSGQGSVEFSASLRVGTSVVFPNRQIILSGVTSDGAERIEIQLAGNDLLAVREMKPCLRQSARMQDAFRSGSPHRIALRWNRASARLTVDGREEPLAFSIADRLPQFAPGRITSGSQSVEVRDLATQASSSLPESPADRRSLDQAKCFDPMNVSASGPVTAVHRGIELRNFKDAEAALEAVRRWIDASSPEMLSTVSTIALTESGTQTWRGLSIPHLKTIYLRPGIATESRIYFHELAHLLDSKHGWRDSHDWGVRFMRLPESTPNFAPGVLGHMDQTSPGEQLVEAVGLAKTEALGLSPGHLCVREENCADKMKFLADRGYLTPAEANLVATQKAPVVTPKVVRASEVPQHRIPTANPTYKTETIVPSQGTSRIDIVLDPQWFQPIDIYRNGGTTVPPTWRGCKLEDTMNRLVRNKPSAINFEPPLKGGLRKYGYFDFGTTKNKRHYLAMDEMPDGSITMHFDMKGNGRLDDTLTKMGKFNDGEKGYATLVEFPWSAVEERAGFEGVVKLWFFSNASEWAISGFSKSNHTQLLGHIQLNGQTYDLIVADTATTDNDGDFTNDGLCLRKAGQKETCWKDNDARAGIEVDGRRYAFNVRYEGAVPR
jgi:hypothetical protein